jgi:hypothetical protein
MKSKIIDYLNVNIVEGDFDDNISQYLSRMCRNLNEVPNRYTWSRDYSTYYFTKATIFVNHVLIYNIDLNIIKIKHTRIKTLKMLLI